MIFKINELKKHYYSIKKFPRFIIYCIFAPTFLKNV